MDTPLWLDIDLPWELQGVARYPFILGPAGFGCNEVEVRRNGKALSPLPGSDWRYSGIGPGNICASILQVGRAQPDRLPLHLLYRFDTPGSYEVQYTLRTSPMPIGFPPSPLDIRTQSEWTVVEVQPAIAGRRSSWLKSIREKMPNDPEELLTNTLPSLAGISDTASLEIIAGYLYHSNASVRQYAMHALYYWPVKSKIPMLQKLLKDRGPNEEAARYLLALQGDAASRSYPAKK